MQNLFDLQLFNEGGTVAATDPTIATTTAVGTEGKTDPTTTTTATTPAPAPKNEAKYTDEDLNRIIGDRLARWQKEQAEKDKVAKMNADQKQKYEIDTLKKENEELKKAAAKVELGKAASVLLKDSNIEATDDILSFVVAEDADSTKDNIEKFVKIIESQVKKAEIARATGDTPKSYTNNGDSLTEIQKRIAKYQ